MLYLSLYLLLEWNPEISLRCASLGSSQAFSEHVSGTRHILDSLDSLVYEVALQSPYSPVFSSSVFFPVFSGSSAAYPICPHLPRQLWAAYAFKCVQQTTWGAAPARGWSKGQQSFRELPARSKCTITLLRTKSISRHQEFRPLSPGLLLGWGMGDGRQVSKNPATFSYWI